MSIKLFITSILFFLPSCNKDYSDMAREQVFNYAKKAQQTHQFELEGFGGSLLTNVKGFALRFTTHKKVSLLEARALTREIAAEFLEQVNKNEEIRPYLEEYPFPPNRLDMMITFKDEENHYYSKDYIAYVSLNKGIIRTSNWDATQPEFKQFCNDTKEPF